MPRFIPGPQGVTRVAFDGEIRDVTDVERELYEALAEIRDGLEPYVEGSAAQISAEEVYELAHRAITI